MDSGQVVLVRPQQPVLGFPGPRPPLWLHRVTGADRPSHGACVGGLRAEQRCGWGYSERGPGGLQSPRARAAWRAPHSTDQQATAQDD